jgi:hypothetical protein
MLAIVDAAASKYPSASMSDIRAFEPPSFGNTHTQFVKE